MGAAGVPANAASAAVRVGTGAGARRSTYALPDGSRCPICVPARGAAGSSTSRPTARPVTSFAGPTAGRAVRQHDHDTTTDRRRRRSAPCPRSPSRDPRPARRQVATLGTIGPDGRPQLSEVWFLADGETVRLSLNTSRQKTKNLLRTRHATCSSSIWRSPYRYLELRGDALVEPDDDYAFADRVGSKYQADLRAHDRPGESRVVVTMQPVRVNAVNMRGPTGRRDRPSYPARAARCALRPMP